MKDSFISKVNMANKITESVMRLEVVTEEYRGLVKYLALQLLGRIPDSIALDDLIQSGMVGLIEAARRYRADLGASFEAFAKLRIRGAMIDELRKNNWLPRSVYKKSRQIAKAVKLLEHSLGRDVRDHEVAKYLELSLEQYHQMLMDTYYGQLFDYEMHGANKVLRQHGFTAMFEEPPEGADRAQLSKQLTQCMQSLPKRECLIVILYYEEDLNLKEIADILGITESRVCQLHSHAMLRLQARLPDCSARLE